MRQLLCSALRALGYTEVVTAGDGRQALKILRGRMIDVVLLDVEMPVLDGFETLTEMRADPNLAAGTAQFGVIRGTRINGREIQLALKILF